jgi:hypothetical protein
MSTMIKRIGGLAYLILAVVLLLIATGAMLGQSDRLIALLKFPPVFGACWVLLVYVVGVRVNTIFHEFGHLAAGWAVGLKLLECQIGRFKIEFGSPGRKMRFDGPPTMFLGHVRAEVPQGRWARLRWCIYLMGGALGSFVLAGLMLFASSELHESFDPPADAAQRMEMPELIFLQTNNFFFSPRSVVVAGLNFVAAVAFGSGVFNLIPLSDRPASDGNALRALLRLKDPNSYFRLRSIANSLVRVRPKDWRQDLVEELSKLSREFSDDATSELWLYYHHLDAGRMEEARIHLDSALARVTVSADFPGVLLEGSYFYALHVGDVAAAKEFRKRSGSVVTREPQTRIRADAAILFAEGSFEAARDLAWTAIEEMKGSLDIGGGIAEREWLATLAIEAESRRAVTVTPHPASASADPSLAAF